MRKSPPSPKSRRRSTARLTLVATAAAVALPAVTLLALTLLAGTPLHAAQENFSDATSVLLIEVPVQVVDRDGNPVRGLTAEDFEIREGRQRREVVSFEVVDRAAPMAADQLPPTAARRHFLLLFDLSLPTPESVERMMEARAAAFGLLDRLHASDLVAVGTYSPDHGPRLVLRFTPDRRQIAIALATLGFPELLQQEPERLAMIGDAALTGGEVDWIDLEAEVRSKLDKVRRTSGLRNEEQETVRVRALARSIEELSGRLALTDGHKQLVLLSEGFESRLLTGGAFSARQRSAIEAGRHWESSDSNLYGKTDAYADFDRMARALERADCALHTVSIANLAAGQGFGASARDALATVAQMGGGESFDLLDDLGVTLEPALAKSDVTYLLAFQLSGEETAGDDFREIEVRLDDKPRGTDLFHRPGYLPLQAKARTPGRLGGESRDTLASFAGPPIELAVLAAPFPAGRDMARVPLVVDVDGASLLGPPADDAEPATPASTADGEAPDAQAPEPLTVEVRVAAVTDDGEIKDSFMRSLGIDIGQTGDAIRQTGIKLYGELDLPPGDYTVKVQVANIGSAGVGVGSVELTVPDFAAGGMVVLPPMVQDAYDQWVMVRLARREEARSYPFTLGDGGNFIPSARPHVAPGSVVDLEIFGYRLGDGRLTVDAQLLDEGGFVVLGRQLVAVRSDSDSATGLSRLHAQLDLGDIAAGDYLLSVGVFNVGSKQRELGTLALRISREGRGTIMPRQQRQIASERKVDRDLPRRLRRIGADYRKVLTQLSAGNRDGAALGLINLEMEVARRSRDVELAELAEGELALARRLAAADPATLIPLVMLHEQVYLGYRDQQRRLLARHAREMVRSLAELYVESGGLPRENAARAFTSLGGTLQQAGLTTSANSLFQRALDLVPDYQAALLSLAVFHEKTGGYAEAQGYLEELLAAHPDNAESWLRLGNCLARQGEHRAAVGWLERAAGAEVEPWIRALAYQQLALLHLELGRLDAAEAVLRRGLDELPAQQRLRLQLAHVLDRQGRKFDAQDTLARLKPDPPGAGESPRYLYNRWPVDLIEISRRELQDTATEQLAVLGRVIDRLAAAGGSL